MEKIKVSEAALNYMHALKRQLDEEIRKIDEVSNVVVDVHRNNNRNSVQDYELTEKGKLRDQLQKVKAIIERSEVVPMNHFPEGADLSDIVNIRDQNGEELEVFISGDYESDFSQNPISLPFSSPLVDGIYGEKEGHTFTVISNDSKGAKIKTVYTIIEITKPYTYQKRK